MSGQISGALARRQQQQSEIANYLQRLQPAIAGVLPKHLSAERVARIALTCVRKDPSLAECLPESFAGSLLTAAALGLEPGVNGEAYLVAYKRECTLIVGYQGLAKLFWQHPLAAHLDAQAVHEHDEFDYAYGLDPFLRHKPAVGDRGAVVAYYAVASLTTGAKVFVVLSPAEAKALRGGKTGSNGGIPDPMHWMERKTALRQLFKLIPKSPLLARALDADDRPGTELRRELAPAEEEQRPALTAVVNEPPAGDPAAGDAPQEPAIVDPDTGEVLEGVTVEEPNEPAWPDAAKPGSRS